MRLAYDVAPPALKPDDTARTYERNARVLVLARVAHRPAGNGRVLYCPLQRIPAGWVGRYIGATWQHKVYDAATDTTARRVVHLVEHPVTGRLHKVLAEDLTLVEERAR